MLNNTTGNDNTAVGDGALFGNATGNHNTAVGAAALQSNTADGDTAIGASALAANTTGESNTATGSGALSSNMDGNANTAVGNIALFSNTSGTGNTAVGFGALINNFTGDQNTAVGVRALQFNSTGDANIALGNAAGFQVTTASNVICIGASVSGEDVSNSCYIGSIFGQISSGGTAVFINADGKLGTTTSSRRFKEEIKPMDKSSEALLALKPVTFRYKKEMDPDGIPQFGLVAEDVEKVNPDLVVRDKEGKAYTVRYEAVNAMLLNEFLKEHRKVEELKKDFQATVAQLTARLDEQSAQIQKGARPA